MAITRRSFIAGLSLIPSVLPTALLAQRTRRKNVLFIVSDDLNRALNVYGHPIVHSPNVDRLAKRGMVFGNAHCQFPLCQPSRTSFMSGMRPETTGVYALHTPTRLKLRDHVFMPEYFRQKGYFTAHAGKVYHTGDWGEDPRSWDEELRELNKSPEPEEILEGANVAGPKGHSFAWAILKTRDAETSDGIVARQAVEYIERAVRERTAFFIGAGFRRPHSPYAAPEKYFDIYPLDRVPLPKTPLSHFDRLLYAAVNHEPPDQPLSDTIVRQARRAYYASVSFTDAQVGLLLDALDRLKLWDDTAVVMTSDHGYHLGDHGGLWHKNTLFDQSARVPLVVASPGQRAVGKHSGRIVELVDIYPTLTDLCGLPPNETLEGTSFAPLLNDPNRKWKRAGFTVQTRGKERKNATRLATDIEYLGHSVRTEQWRYTEWDERRKGAELYDHLSDPHELNNLAGSPMHSAVESEMRRILHAGWKSSLPPRA